MITRSVLAQRMSEGATELTSSLVEHALRSDRLRGLAIQELEKRLVAQTEAAASARPTQVLEDQLDMSRALLRSIDRALERKQVSPEVLHRLLRTMLTTWILRQDRSKASSEQQFAERHGGYRPPATLVISPTKACNLHCTGCYASGPGGEHLEWDVFDRIIREAKEQWGLRFFTISGGEPFAYRSQGRDLLDAADRHSDCFFMTYTNGTLIDERMAEPEDEAATAALEDGQYYEGMMAYDEDLHAVFDPIWEGEYLEVQRSGDSR